MTEFASWQASIVDQSGNIQASASIEVLNAKTGIKAVLYSDREATQAISNPFSADSEGFARFYVKGGHYRVTATKDSLVKIWENVPIGTAAEYDAQDLVQLINSDVYETAEAGEAATSLGDYYWVFSNDIEKVLDLYRNATGSSPSFTFEGSVPSIAAFDYVLQTNIAQQWQASQNFDMVEIAASGSPSAIDWNCEQAQVLKVTLTDDTNINLPTNFHKGGTYILEVQQDGTGGHSLSFNSIFKWPYGFTPTVQMGADETTIFTFLCNFDEDALLGNYNSYE